MLECRYFLNLMPMSRSKTGEVTLPGRRVAKKLHCTTEILWFVGRCGENGCICGEIYHFVQLRDLLATD